MQTIQQVGFKTSVFTGTGQRESVGQGLAKIVQSAIGGYAQVSKIIKSQNEEEDILLLSDMKVKAVQKMRESGYDNLSGLEQESILKDIENMERPEFTNRIYDNQFTMMIEDFKIKNQNKIIQDSIDSINNEVIPGIGLNYNAYDMNMIDSMSNSFKDLGVEKPKEKILKSIIENIDGELTSNTNFLNMTRSQIVENFPILREIKNPKLTDVLYGKINELDKQRKKKLYDNDISKNVLNNELNLGDIAKLATRHNKSMIDVYSDIKKDVGNTLELLSMSDDIGDKKQAISTANKFNKKIERVEKSASSLIDSAISDTAYGFNNYSYVKSMLEQGYILKSDNTKDFNILTGIANDLGIEINSEADLKKVAGFALTRRDNPNPRIKLSDLKENDLYKDASINEQTFILEKATELSAFMDKDTAINIASGLASNYLLGDSKIDYSGIDSINTNEQADLFFEHLEETKNWDDLDIRKAGSNYIIIGKLKGTGEYDRPEIISAAEMNIRAKYFMSQEEEKNIYLDGLGGSGKNKKHLPSTLIANANTNKVLVDLYSELKKNEGSYGDNATDIETGKFGMTAEKKSELENKYSRKLTDEEAIKITLSENYIALKSSLNGFDKLTDTGKLAIMDSMYNLGSFKNFDKFKDAVSKGDEEKAMYELLDTASINGMGSKGLAKRRAINYNKVAKDKITKVVQNEDGEIEYHTDTELIMLYKPKKGIHPSSKNGTIKIN